MKRRRAIASILALSGLISAGAPAEAKSEKAGQATGLTQEPGGRLEVARESVDVGSVAKGQTATAVFELRNVGAETLRILQAKPG